MSPVTVVFVDDEGLPLHLRPPAKPLEGEGAPVESLSGEPGILAEPVVPPEAVPEGTEVQPVPASPPRKGKARRSAARRKAGARPQPQRRARRRPS